MGLPDFQALNAPLSKAKDWQTSIAVPTWSGWAKEVDPVCGDTASRGGERWIREGLQERCGEGGVNGLLGNQRPGNRGAVKARDESRRGRPVARGLHSSNSFRPFNDGTFCKRAHIARPRSVAAIVRVVVERG